MEKKNALLNLLAFALEVRSELDEKLSADEMTASGTWETWSAKDGLAHIAHWLDSDLRNIETARQMPVIDEHNIDEVNKKIYESWSEKTWDEIDRFCSDTFNRAISLVQSMDEKRLLENLERVDGSKRPIWQSVAGHGLSHMISHIALIYRRRGEVEATTALEEKAAGFLRDLDDAPEWRGTIEYNLACNYALAGDKKRAFASLGEALKLNPKLTEWSKKDPDFESFRDDPEFADIVGTK